MPRIVVDSGCDLPLEFKVRYPDIEISSVPLTLTVDGTDFSDDGNLDTLAYLELSERSVTGPVTAAPSPQLFLECCHDAGSVFIVTISSKLSASFESASLAARMRADQIRESLTHVFDSLSASVGEAQLVMRIADLIRENTPDLEIIERVEKFISQMHTFFILDNFDTAVRTGRMSKTVATMAEFLNIKPLCAGVNGEMKVIGKARNYQRTVALLIKEMRSRCDDFSNRVLGISHVQAYEKALATQTEIMAMVPFRDSFITAASGLCSTYAARGGLIFAF
jgi:DegV family protein with EDD domain